MSKMIDALPLLVLLLPTMCVGSCDMLGCDPTRSFDLGTELDPATLPRLSNVWSVTVSDAEAVRCVAVLTQIVCTVDRPTSESSGTKEGRTRNAAAAAAAADEDAAATDGDAGIVGFDSASGAALFNDTQIPSAATYPCTIDEEIVVVNNVVMAGITFTGAPTGTPIPLQLVGVFSPAPTDNDALLYLCRNGELAAYLSNGVPHASIQVGGLPITPPVVVSNRAFILARTGRIAGKDCTLHAIDLHRTMDNRLQLMWSTVLGCPASAPHGASTTPALVTAQSPPSPPTSSPPSSPREQRLGGEFGKPPPVAATATAVAVGATCPGLVGDGGKQGVQFVNPTTGKIGECIPVGGTVGAFAVGRQGLWVAVSGVADRSDADTVNPTSNSNSSSSSNAATDNTSGSPPTAGARLVLLDCASGSGRGSDGDGSSGRGDDVTARVVKVINLTTAVRFGGASVSQPLLAVAVLAGAPAPATNANANTSSKAGAANGVHGAASADVVLTVVETVNGTLAVTAANGATGAMAWSHELEFADGAKGGGPAGCGGTRLSQFAAATNDPTQPRIVLGVNNTVIAFGSNAHRSNTHR